MDLSDALLSELNAKRYELMRNADKHCRLEASWEHFQREIASVEQTRQSCAATASHLEERLRRLQGDLRWRGGYYSGDPSPSTLTTRSAIGASIASRTTVAIDTECTNECDLSTPHPNDQETARIKRDDIQVLDVADDDSSIPLATAGSNELLVDESPIMIHPDHALKLQQYLFRIQALEQDIVICQQSQQALSERRSFLSLQLVQAQERILELNSVIDRVALYNGREIISNVLHGSDQKFTVFELKRDLHEELRAVKGHIATWKAEIIGGDTKVENLQAKLIAKKLRLIERRGALKVVRSQLQSADHICARLNDTSTREINHRRDANSILFKHLQQWRSIARENRVIGSALDSLSKLLTRRTCTEVLRLWLEAVCGATATADDDVYNKVSAEVISELSGAGDALLVQAQRKRHGNARELVSIMSNVASAGIDPSHFDATDTLPGAEGRHAPAPEFLTGDDRTLYFKANFYYATEELNDALRSYDLLLESLSRASDTTYAVSASREDMANLYCFLYIRLGSIHLNLKQSSKDVALMFSDRALKIAEEFNFNQHITQALICIGECYFAKEEQATAAIHFDRAIKESSSDSTGGRSTTAAAHRGLEKCYNDLGMAKLAQNSKSVADQLTRSREMRLSAATEKIDELKSRLVNVTAETADVVTLQRVTPHYIELKLEKRSIQQQIEGTKQEAEDIDRATSDSNTLLRAIDNQLKEARAPDAPAKMISSLVHENAQEFDTSELIHRLEIRREKVLGEVDVAEEHRRRLLVTIKNLQDDLEGIRNDMQVENGPLMQRILDKRIIRCMALSSSNAAGNDVMGGATGGVEYCVLSEGKSIYVHSLSTGKLLFVFRGDEEGKHVGGLVGHTSYVTCLYSYGIFIYSGSMDRTIMCWSADDGQRHFVARGHEATVTCINVDDTKMISGSADKTIGVWDRATGQLFHRLDGHPSGILSVQCGPSWCVSGDGDGTVLVWDDNFECRQNLRLPRARITVVRYGELELITGDSNGRIAIWWIKTGTVLQQCKAHQGSVADLQFDATRVISCGYDWTVQVIDILTGDVLQTLRGHNGPILAVSFDSRSILSASRDGTLRRWVWGDLSTRFEDKIHTFVVGDTLPSISQKYGVTVSELITWNGIRDVKLLYPGQKLIVRKGDPNSRTKAEVRAERSIQREQDREKRMMRLCLKSDTGTIDEAEDAANKINDMMKSGLADDPATLFNRCLGTKKEKIEAVTSISSTASKSNPKREEMSSSGKGTLSLRLRRQ